MGRHRNRTSCVAPEIDCPVLALGPAQWASLGLASVRQDFHRTNGRHASESASIAALPGCPGVVGIGSSGEVSACPCGAEARDRAWTASGQRAAEAPPTCRIRDVLPRSRRMSTTVSIKCIQLYIRWPRAAGGGDADGRPPAILARRGAATPRSADACRGSRPRRRGGCRLKLAKEAVLRRVARRPTRNHRANELIRLRSATRCRSVARSFLASLNVIA